MLKIINTELQVPLEILFTCTGTNVFSKVSSFSKVSRHDKNESKRKHNIYLTNNNYLSISY